MLHLFLLFLLLPLPIIAAPWRRSALEKRQIGNAMNAAIVVPIIVLGTTVILGGLFLWIKRRRARRGSRPNGTPSRTSNTGAREVTADQLAGQAATTTTTTPAPRTRRGRRGRRPSQMSVTSLPEYMKEPGDAEVVIIRGPADMEDEPERRPSTVVVSHNAMNNHSRADSDLTIYSQIPDTPHDMPLMSNNEHTNSPDLSELPPPGQLFNGTRQSVDSSDVETSSLVRVTSNDIPDPRGEAPAYFEAVDLSADTTLPDQSTPAPITTSPPARSPSTRLSGFRNIFQFGRNQPSSSQNAANTTHNRDGSIPSIVTSDASHEREASRSHSRVFHRPSHSGGSVLSLTPFRSLSRQKSVTSMNRYSGMNSPSLISLNSISAPLTHTATRTEFSYPKSGPTPEQVKFISSREAFSRFGMPYGEDAIAFASISRQDLVPPPDFEASTSAVNLRASVEDTESTEEPAASSSTIARPASPSQIPLPESPVQTPSQEPSTDPTPISLPPPATETTRAPPSSFHLKSPYEGPRPESRASSLATFATAAETIGGVQSDGETITSRHESEPTDDTIRQASTRSRGYAAF